MGDVVKRYPIRVQGAGACDVQRTRPCGYRPCGVGEGSSLVVDRVGKVVGSSPIDDEIPRQVTR